MDLERKKDFKIGEGGNVIGYTQIGHMLST